MDRDNAYLLIGAKMNGDDVWIFLTTDAPMNYQRKDWIINNLVSCSHIVYYDTYESAIQHAYDVYNNQVEDPHYMAPVHGIMKVHTDIELANYSFVDAGSSANGAIKLLKATDKSLCNWTFEVDETEPPFIVSSVTSDM